jgi:hypothetical protein
LLVLIDDEVGVDGVSLLLLLLAACGAAALISQLAQPSSFHHTAIEPNDMSTSSYDVQASASEHRRNSPAPSSAVLLGCEIVLTSVSS